MSPRIRASSSGRKYFCRNSSLSYSPARRDFGPRSRYTEKLLVPILWNAMAVLVAKMPLRIEKGVSGSTWTWGCSDQALFGLPYTMRTIARSSEIDVKPFEPSPTTCRMSDDFFPGTFPSSLCSNPEEARNATTSFHPQKSVVGLKRAPGRRAPDRKSSTGPATTAADSLRIGAGQSRWRTAASFQRHHAPRPGPTFLILLSAFTKAFL